MAPGARQQYSQIAIAWNSSLAARCIPKVYPDRANFPNLMHPPSFADLELDGTARPELRIDGYLGDHLALSRSFSSDPSADKLLLQADDGNLIADGADATRLVFKIVDKFGAERPFAAGEVKFEITGPGIVVGDNPFSLLDSGGVAAVWIKTLPNRNGMITVEARHSTLGTKFVNLDVQRLPGTDLVCRRKKQSTLKFLKCQKSARLRSFRDF